MLVIKVFVEGNDKKNVFNNRYNTPAKWPKVKLFHYEEKEAEANSYSPCVFTIRQTPNYVHHQFLFWDCKLTRFLNKKFLGHLRWNKYSSAVSNSPKNFVRKRDLGMGRLASKWVWTGDGTILSSLFLHISVMKFEKINFQILQLFIVKHILKGISSQSALFRRS